jgi:phospholipid/cholesterol/gamma-HCH transport system substrate-binding protein
VRSETSRFGARASLERIDSIFVNTRVVTVELRGVSGNISTASRSFSGTLTLADSTLLSMNRVTTRLEGGKGSLGRLFSDTLLGSRAENLVEELNLLMKDIRANPRKYVRLSIF